MLKNEAKKKPPGFGNIFFLIVAAAVPAVGATDADTIVGTEVYYQTGMSWSGVNSTTLIKTVRPAAGGATPYVTVTIPWDELATVDLIVVNQFSGVQTNTGDTKRFTEAMGSVFYGKGSYHTFSDLTGEGYDKYWISPENMYVTSGRSGKSVTVESTLTVYAESKAEAEEKIKAGFKLLGLEAETSVIASQTIGTRVEYTVKVTTSLYQYRYTTIYSGTIQRHYHIKSNSPYIVLSWGKEGFVAQSNNVNVYDLYDSKDFNFPEHFTFYSYENIDLESLGHYGTLTT